MAEIRYLGINVLTAAQQRIEYVFDNFTNIYLSFSGGKDSGVMLHLVADEARKRGVRFGLLCIDLEAQYQATIKFMKEMFEEYKDCIIPYWVALPLSLDNAVSSYEPRWICWEPDKKNEWVREPPSFAITHQGFFPFYRYAMEFEEFTHEFGKWYSEGRLAAVFIGIRAEESFNRHLKVRVKKNREFFDNKMWILKQKSTGMPVYSTHPIYDWKTQDIWRYCGKYYKPYNKVYDLMHQAGVSIWQQRLCQPYGSDQRKGLWMYHILEPDTWGKVVKRVSGVNSGSEFVKYSGNVSGQVKIYKPDGHTWKSFALLLLQSMPKTLADHYDDKIYTFLDWWEKQGGYYDLEGYFHGFYGANIPDEVDQKLEVAKKAPSWRRICKALLRSDYWCKGLSFQQQESHAYDQYKRYMARRKQQKGYMPLWNRKHLEVAPCQRMK